MAGVGKKLIPEYDPKTNWRDNDHSPTKVFASITLSEDDDFESIIPIKKVCTKRKSIFDEITMKEPKIKPIRIILSDVKKAVASITTPKIEQDNVDLDETDED